MGLAADLDRIHHRLLAGSRVAARDLFAAALSPLKGHLAKTQPALDDEARHDLATDAILSYLEHPARCDVNASSLWTYLCLVASRNATDAFRAQARHRRLLAESADVVEEWSGRANNVRTTEDGIDARRILEQHGHRLTTNETEVKLLQLLLEGERSTDVFAGVLGLDPSADDTVALVKQAKDRMRIRLLRLRGELEL
jgi:DNA-directed RNA polymerase specialized sigma24 family protein